MCIVLSILALKSIFCQDASGLPVMLGDRPPRTAAYHGLFQARLKDHFTLVLILFNDFVSP